MEARAIGITSLKIARAGVEGLGYAISTDEAVPVIEELIASGFIVRPWLGVSVRTVNPFIAQMFGLSVEEGVLVTEVAAASPAQEAGLQQGDVIVAIDGSEVQNANDLRQAIHSSEVGAQMEVSYWRGESQQSAQVTLAESQPPQ
jgi:serine protease Do